MSQNDIILLNQMLDQRIAEVGAGLSTSKYFEIFSSEQILKDEDAYRRIFNSSYPLDLYYKCSVIARVCDDFLKNHDEYWEHSNNLRFFLATVVSLRLSGVPKPSIAKIATIDLAKLSEDLIVSAAKDVYKDYITLGGSDSVAKGPNLEKKIIQKHESKVVKGLRKKQAKK